MLPKLETILIQTARGNFGAIASGPLEGPLVVCLHGFPDNMHTFSELLLQLSACGYRAVAPALRGYWPSPTNGPYGVIERTNDLFSILDELSPSESVCIIGHDLGGHTTYKALATRPDRFSAAVVLAAPHTNSIIENSKKSLKQLWLSRYVILMQVKGFAEWWVSRQNFSYVDYLWRCWSPGFKPPIEHISSIKNTLTKSMPAPVLMYRSGEWSKSAEEITVPTLLLLGGKDGCVLTSMADNQAQYFSPGKYESKVNHNVGHFLHLEDPEGTWSAIRGWFRGQDQASIT